MDLIKVLQQGIGSKIGIRLSSVDIDPICNSFKTYDDIFICLFNSEKVFGRFIVKDSFYEFEDEFEDISNVADERIDYRIDVKYILTTEEYLMLLTTQPGCFQGIHLELWFS